MKEIEEMKEELERRKQEAIKEIIDLKYTKETAEEILKVYLEESSLAAQKRWPREFGLFASGRTVLDILGESKVRYLSNQLLCLQKDNL